MKFNFFRIRARKAKPFKEFQLEKTEKGDYDSFHSKLLDSSLVILITGKRGSGKTALGMKMLEIFAHARKKCYAIGFSKGLPRFIKSVRSVEDVPNNSVLLIDEAAILFFARDAMSKINKMISKIMAIARHKGLLLILVSQSSALLELNVLRLSDTLIFKEPSLMQAKFERKALQEMYKKITPIFKSLQEKKKYFYIWDDEFEGLLSFDLPYFWNEKISKSFASW